jgi:DNA-cytosine methyltransferase
MRQQQLKLLPSGYFHFGAPPRHLGGGRVDGNAGTPLRIVDIFSGCGGLSLGFQMARQGSGFETVLAIDVDRDALDVLDRNHSRIRGDQAARIGRARDLSTFGCPAEIRAFYLAALGASPGAPIAKALAALDLDSLRNRLRRLDEEYFARANAQIRTDAFKRVLARADRRTLSGTILKSFLARFHFPTLGGGFRDRPVLPWTEDAGDPGGSLPGMDTPRVRARPRLSKEQNREFLSALDHVLENIEELCTGASAFLVSEGFARLSKINMDWRARRTTIIRGFFEDPARVRRINRLYAKSPVHGLVGAPPCQVFSNAGRSRMKNQVLENRQAQHDSEFGDRRSGLFRAYLAFLDALRPMFFVFENVPRIQTEIHTGDGRSINIERTIRAELQEIDDLPYVAEPLLVQAHEFSVPQKRQRYLLIGFHNGKVPADVRESMLRIVEQAKCPTPTPSAEAFEGLFGETAQVSFVEHGSRRSPTVHVNGRRPGRVDRCTRRYLDFIRKGPDGRRVTEVADHWCREPNPDDRPFFDRLEPGEHWAKVDDLEQVLRDINPEHHLLKGKYLDKARDTHKDWLARIHHDRPSRTICAHLAKDGYAYIHPHEPRTISVREAARIQSFPDWFSFHGASMSASYRMIGNAFPPLVARVVAEAISEALYREDPKNAETT